MEIEASTAQVSESTDTLKVNVSAKFQHDLPEPSEHTSAADCIATLVATHGAEEIYKLVRRQYVVDIQSAGRRELVEQWHSIAPDTRMHLIQMPLGENGEHATKGVATATLPEAQRAILQERMNAWRLGEKAQRVRVVRVQEDVIDALARKINSQEITPEELETIRARAAEILGMTASRKR